MAALDTAAEPGATIDLNRYTKPTSIALKARHVETQPDALAGLSLEERAKVQRALAAEEAAAEERTAAEKAAEGAAAEEKAAAVAGLSLAEWRALPPHVVPESAVPLEPHSGWAAQGGPELENVLRAGAIALLDGAWVVELAAKPGTVIGPRQSLPPEAFISLDAIQAQSSVSLGLRVACCSYPWLQPDHPDPKGANLRLIARVLDAYLKADGGRWALFWDFPCLHQHAGAPGGKRPPAEELLFKEALKSLGTFYAHAKTTTFMLTAFPDGYPSGYSLPAGANVAEYADRGWCFTEASWSQLTKDYDFALDLGRLTDASYTKEEMVGECTSGGGRRPPLVPARFEQALSNKSFTNGKDDRPLVAKLYADGFAEQMGKATSLNFSRLGWGDAEAELVAEVIGSGALAQCQELSLDGNLIGDDGMTAFAQAIKPVSEGGSGALPIVTSLGLSHRLVA